MGQQELPEKLVISQGNTLTSGNDQKTWVKCPECGDEYRSLHPSGLCLACFTMGDNVKKHEFITRSRIEEMIGAKGFDEFTLERYRVSAGTQNAFDAAKNFSPEADNLYLYGPPGTGKSHLTGAIIRKWFEVRGHRNVEYHKVKKMIRWFRMRKPVEEQEEINRLSRLHVLAIDDLGVEKDSEHALGVLYEILDARDMARRNGLIITSNLSSEDLALKMGDDRLPSRIFGMCKVVKLEAPDARINR